MAICQSTVKRLYQSVIDDVIANVRDSFFDEGVDEQILMELKQLWESKLSSLKALEPLPESSEPQPPSLSTHTHARQATNSKNANAAVNIPHQTAGDAAMKFKQNYRGAIVKKVMDNARGVAAAAAAGVITTTTTSASMPSSSNTTVSAPPPALPLNQIPAAPAIATLPPELGRMVPIQITLPPTPGSGETQSRVLNIQVPAAALQGNQLHSILSGPIMTATLALPAHVASSLLQQHITAAFQGQAAATVQAQRTITSQPAAQQVAQLDGLNDSSDDDLDDDLDDDDDDDDDVDEDKEDSAGEDSGGKEEEPLNSGDDVSDEDVAEQFDTDNVVVCQYDKVTRSRNKWKFYLKDGIMNLNGRDFVFQKANGDAEW